MQATGIERVIAIERVGQLVARGTMRLGRDDYYVVDGTVWRITDNGAVNRGDWFRFAADIRAGAVKAKRV